MDTAGSASYISPKKNKHKNLSSEINEPKIVRTRNKTYSYGETPAAICRRHFEEMASNYNVPMEELAESVLKGSLTDQLLKLAEYYKSKDKDTEAVFNPLVQQATKNTLVEQSSDGTFINKPVPKERTPAKMMQIIVSPKKIIRARELSQNDNDQPIGSKHQQENKKKSLVVKESSSKQVSFPGDAITNTSAEQSIPINLNPLRTDPPDVSSNINDKGDESLSELGSIKSPVNPAISQQPSPSAHVSERKETTEELEAFLFGDLPYVAKTPPRKKLKKRTEFTTPESAPTSVETSSLTSPGFIKPALTFDPTKWSPSRQRDLLSIAKDIAKLQRSLESGDLPEEPVSKLVSFSNTSDDS